MSHTTAARLYFLFALLLLAIGWKIAQESRTQADTARAEEEAAIERILSSVE